MDTTTTAYMADIAIISHIQLDTLDYFQENAPMPGSVTCRYVFVILALLASVRDPDA